MKTLRSLTLFLSMLALAAGLGASDFTGMIRLKVVSQEKSGRRSNGDGSMFMNCYYKGSLMRTDVEIGNGQTSSSIIDTVKQEVIILMPEQHKYMVMQMPQPAKSDASAASSAAAAKDVEFVRTGETDTILGYKCEKILVKSKEGEAEVWGAEGLGVFQGMSSRGPMGRPSSKSAWEKTLAAHGFFPLRMVSHDKSGKELMRMEAVAIDMQPPADSLFVPPGDYQKFEMPSFPGFGGMGASGQGNE